MMKRTILLLVIAALLVSGFAQAAMIQTTGLQGKCTDGRYPDDVISEARIGTRSGTFPDAKKTWLQFDLADLYAANPDLQGNILSANLVFYGAKAETSNKDYLVNGLNDDAGLEAWDATALTWNNAPGNDTTDGKALMASVTTYLYKGTALPPCLDTMTETPDGDRATLAAFLNTDTDGKVTFIFTAGSTTYLWNVGAELEPVLQLEYIPEPATMLLLGLGGLVSLRKRR